ncbi:hypothetical protein NQ314_005732 [Rhamnusium bicolor]|uniref:HAT C-terminal dimerisation domain-containing protein n=1 Tax=Rhamnusium bicolor TaxID=1586634 RepID=A0AAV8ZGF5_9CUCU|nr:hypothetical protein NQ314_005732 [Rhamnusium bicolor]
MTDEENEETEMNELIVHHWIDPQAVDNEWRKHATIDHEELDLNNKDNATDYWHNVFKLKNAAGIELFSNLKIVIHVILVLPFSNASVERIFSKMNDTKTDLRNCLNTDTLSALLHTKQGVKDAGGLLVFEPNLKSLVANRGVYKSQLTKFSTFLDSLQVDKSKIDELQTSPEPENETLIINDLSDIPEIKSLTITNVSTSPFHTDFFDYFSSFTKLQRITAYCLRFINKMRKVHTHSHSDKLTIQEINDSTTKLIKLAQFEAFSSEIQFIKKGKTVPTNGKLVALSPFMDESGVLRVGERLKH